MHVDAEGWNERVVVRSEHAVKEQQQRKQEARKERRARKRAQKNESESEEACISRIGFDAYLEQIVEARVDTDACANVPVPERVHSRPSRVPRVKKGCCS